MKSIQSSRLFFHSGPPLFINFFLILFILVGPVLGSEPLSATVSAGSPTPSPEPGLGPNLSALDLSYDTKAFFQKVSGICYDYNQRGLKEFRCQIDDDGWDSIRRLLLLQETQRREDQGENGVLGSDSTAKMIENLKFVLTYTHEEGFKFAREDYTSTGNADYDKLADQLTLMVGGEVLLFSKAWDGVLGLKKPPKEKPEIKVVKSLEGYTLTQTIEGQTSVWIFQNSGLLSEAWFPSLLKSLGRIHLGFIFQKVNGGYLPTIITFKTENGDVSGEVHVDYEDAGNFEMPKRVLWNCEYPDKDKDKSSTGDSLAFFNYLVNGTPVESPLPRQPSTDVFYLMQKAFNEGVNAGFEFHVGFGPFLSDSPQVKTYPGYNGAFGIGWEINRSFSLSFELQGADYQTPDKINDLYFTELMLLGKYRLFTGDFRPYLTGGMGVGISEYFPVGNYTQTIAHDTNFVAEAGGGLEVQVAKNFFLFAQSSYVDHQLSPSFAQMTGVNNPFQFVPLQFGITFER